MPNNTENQGTTTNGTVDNQNRGVEERPGFFQEDNGNHSSMRLMCFTALIAAIVFGLLTLLLKSDNGNGIYVTFGFLISAFAPKAVQKFAEQKVPTRG
ncbi:MAG: hypothetical protein ACU843_17445 [Gammaproteobacteria bacterium]